MLQVNRNKGQNTVSSQKPRSDRGSNIWPFGGEFFLGRVVFNILYTD